jgi:hypothetical protein
MEYEKRPKEYNTLPKTLSRKTLAKMYPADMLELFVEDMNN